MKKTALLERAKKNPKRGAFWVVLACPGMQKSSTAENTIRAAAPVARLASEWCFAWWLSCRIARPPAQIIKIFTGFQKSFYKPRIRNQHKIMTGRCVVLSMYVVIGTASRRATGRLVKGFAVATDQVEAHSQGAFCNARLFNSARLMRVYLPIE